MSSSEGNHHDVFYNEVNLTQFIRYTEATKKDVSNIIVNIGSYKKQKDVTPIIGHSIGVVTDGLLNSQQYGHNTFNVVTVFPDNFGQTNMDFELIGKLSKVMMKTFPGNLKNYYIVNPPKIFALLWGVLKKVFDKNLREKVVIIKKNGDKIDHLDKINNLDEKI